MAKTEEPRILPTAIAETVDDYEKWRNLVRTPQTPGGVKDKTVRDTVSCPYCTAFVGKMCRTLGDRTRSRVHPARMALFEAATDRPGFYTVRHGRTVMIEPGYRWDRKLRRHVNTVLGSGPTDPIEGLEVVGEPAGKPVTLIEEAKAELERQDDDVAQRTETVRTGLRVAMTLLGRQRFTERLAELIVEFDIDKKILREALGAEQD